MHDVFDAAAADFVDAAGDLVTVAGSEVMAVFGQGFTAVTAGELRIASTRPELYVRTADLPSSAAAAQWPPEGGDAVTVLGKHFEVAHAKPDVEGVGVTLVLKSTD